MKFRAFTLVEVLVCLAIVVTVAAISYPVVSMATRRGIEASAKSALRQQWLAVALYREEWGGGQDHGTAQQMALPLDSTRFFASGVVPPYRNAHQAYGYLWYPKEEGLVMPALVAEWVRYSERCRSQSILLADPNHNAFPTLDARFAKEPKQMLGVFFDGSVHSRVRSGDPVVPGWWNCRP